MHYVTTTDEQDDILDADVARLLTPRTIKDLKTAVTDALYPVYDDIIEALIEDTGSNYRDVAIRNTRQLLSDVLSGDKDAARTLFACDGYDSGKHHSIIHGHVHEPDDIQLRRQLVEAHPDLLKDQRVKDLEALVKNMREDMGRLRDENRHLRNR